MSIETFDKAPWIPKTEEEKAAVRRQLHRLLETSHFKNSKRYPALFRFIVEETLEGRGEFLKERLLGVRVFDRPTDYDTASDPIVRVTIAEIRKRIAQYYHEDAHESEMRIELSPGRYEPEFRWRPEVGAGQDRPFSVQATERAFVPAMLTVPSEVVTDPIAAAPQRSRARKKATWAIAAMIVVVVGGWFGWRWMHPSAIEQFWVPVLGQRGDVTVCVPMATGWEGVQAQSKVVSGALVRSAEKSGQAPQQAERTQKGQTFLEHESLGEDVVFSDVRAAMRASEYMIEHGHATHLLMSTGTTLDDLRQGPVLLVGGLDNQWTMRALSPLRYQFAGSDVQGFWIVDTKHPEKKDWWLDLKKKYAVVDRDYAIVARIHDATTGEPVVIVAGIGMSGTVAASELLADSKEQEELRRRVGAGFGQRDFEAVISTDVVNGMTGSPKIQAVVVW